MLARCRFAGQAICEISKVDDLEWKVLAACEKDPRKRKWIKDVMYAGRSDLCVFQDSADMRDAQRCLQFALRLLRLARGSNLNCTC